jgi:hypothetical protein
VAQLNVWNVDWYLDEATCPCDVHFLEYLDQEKIKGAAIFHFGTGGHHVVGIRTAENGSGNLVLGITASQPEHDAYEKLIIERPEFGRSYKVLFGDIYQLEPALLPPFDVVTLFHTGEFRTKKNDAYGALTDEEVVRLLVDKLKGPRLLAFYSGSYAFDVADRIAKKLVAEGLLEPAGEYKTLRIFRKRKP